MYLHHCDKAASCEGFLSFSLLQSKLMYVYFLQQHNAALAQMISFRMNFYRTLSTSAFLINEEDASLKIPTCGLKALCCVWTIYEEMMKRSEIITKVAKKLKPVCGPKMRTRQVIKSPWQIRPWSRWKTKLRRNEMEVHVHISIFMKSI